jgi:TetR/AcrR family transcriptional regulator, regulator of mycofactocin system
VAEGLDPKQSRKLQTRRRIEDTALQLFARNGFDDTTVEQIAAACDISPRTFFRYFPSKDEVIFAEVGEELELICDYIRSRPAREGPYATIREATIQLASDYEEKRERIVSRSRLVRLDPRLSAHSGRLSVTWTDKVADVLAERHPDQTDHISRLMASIGSAALVASIREWSGEGDLVTIMRATFARLEQEVGGG